MPAKTKQPVADPDAARLAICAVLDDWKRKVLAYDRLSRVLDGMVDHAHLRVAEIREILEATDAN